jgi:hypothetical protein
MLYTFLRRSFRVAAAMSICVDAVTDWFQEVRISFEKVCVVVESRVELADLVMELTSCTDVIMILRGSYATRHSCNHASKRPRRCKFYLPTPFMPEDNMSFQIFACIHSCCKISPC